MTTFKYEAIDSIGRPVKGTIDAINSDEAIAKIRSRGQFPTKIKKVKPSVILEPIQETVQKKHKSKINAKWVIQIGIGIGLVFIGILIGLCIK